jgi:hypothetical protein
MPALHSAPTVSRWHWLLCHVVAERTSRMEEVKPFHQHGQLGTRRTTATLISSTQLSQNK